MRLALLTPDLLLGLWLGACVTLAICAKAVACTDGPVPRASAGVLLYRHRHGVLEVLLVHPGGPFWQRKDDGAWSVPKGEFAAGESAEAAARREFREEFDTLRGWRPERQSASRPVEHRYLQAALGPA